MSTPAWTPATSKSRVSVGVQAGVPGYSVNLLLFTYWYFSSGHLRFSGRWCPNLNLAKISLSLSGLKSTHHYFITWLAITMVVHCHCSSRIFRCVLVSFAKSLSSFLHTQRKYLTIMKSTTNHQWLKLSQRKNCRLLFCSFDESKSPHNLYWNKNAFK